jgi:signal transduction histidine kinase
MSALLGFTFSAHALILLPNRSGALWVALLALLVGATWVYHDGWTDGLLAALLYTAGYAAFGYAYYARDRAEAARRESQALLAELQRAHRQLQDYAERVEELALAEERARLARELHDSAKQPAFAASAQLAAAHSVLNRDPGAAGVHLAEAERWWTRCAWS